MKKFVSNHILSLILVMAMASGALGAVMADYTAVPPFLTTSVPPNLLLLIDNSASMYDLAYVDDQEYCYDDTYNVGTVYAGYCVPGTIYIYDFAQSQFEASTPVAAAAHLAGAGGTVYQDAAAVGIAVDTTVTPNQVKAFVATGNFINWATASKFDIEKKILTGGKLEATGTYGAPNNRLVMESRGCVNKRYLKQKEVLDAGGTTYYLALGIQGPQEPEFPPWENATAYVIGDIVNDLGELYRATSAGTSNGTGVADDTGVSWQAYTRTRWTDGAWYPANSIVSDGDEFFITAAGGTANGTGVEDDTGITDWDAYHVTHIEFFPVTTSGFDNSGCELAVEELQKASPNQGQLKVYIDDCMGYTAAGAPTKEADSNGAFNHSIHNCWYMAKAGVWPPGAGPETSIKNDCEHIYTTWGTDPWDITTEDMGYVCYGVWNTDPANAPDIPPTGYVGRCWRPAGAPVLTCTRWKNPVACQPAVRPDPACCQTWGWVGGGPGGWDAAGYADVLTCIETALMDYCGILEIPEVVDPTDIAGESGEFWNIPAVLIDSGSVAQMGQPLAIVPGYVQQTALPTGLIQEYATEAHMGVMAFNDEGSASECTQPDPYILYKCTDPNNRDGSQVTAAIGSATATLVSAINDIDADSWTPIAEAMYNAVGYYTQNAALRLNPLDFSVAAGVAGTDPVTEWCQANNVLIITDGSSTADESAAVSAFVAGAGQNDTDTDPVSCGSLNGSGMLDDLSYYGKLGTNIYPVGNRQIDGEDKQNVTTYIVVAGSMRSDGSNSECSPEILLEDAADYGRGLTGAAAAGTTSLYQATNLTVLEAKLREAFEAIVSGASSGTAASVVSAARRGEGAVYQAVFYLNYEDDNGTEIDWIGKLHALFVDQYGSMREDTDANQTLSLTTDRLVVLYFDPAVGRTKARLYNDTDGDGEADVLDAEVEIDDIKYLWEGGKSLAIRDPATRDIWTWIDKDNDGVVDGGGALDTDEFVTFSDAIASTLQPYLAVDVAPTTTETTKTINWVRGTDVAGYRSRTIEIDGTDRVWKLGDIIYSTPTLIGKPGENWEFTYNDSSYKAYKNKYNNRRHVLYVGSNDGQLHAFNAGFYNAGASKFEVGTNVPAYSAGVPTLGEELWAYIPYNLLPHLRWLKRTDYEHVYYVDNKPRVIDAKIFSDDADHPGGWGTVLICGMRFGGGAIDVTEAEVNYDFNGDTDKLDTKTFTSSYFAFDITNPEEMPTLLWEFTDSGLGFTTSYPGIVHVDHLNSDWWLAFGSGPTDYDGTSTQLGQTYVLHLETGGQPVINNSPIQTNWGAGFNSAMADVISVDYDINASQCAGDPQVCTFTPDAFYIGDTQGTMWRISCVGGNWAGTQTALVSLGNTKPITAAPSASQDDDGRMWIYFGTGQFYHENDKSNADAQSLVGVKEPIDWFDWDSDGDDDELTIYHNGCMSAETVPVGNLLNVTNYEVFEGGYVDTDGDLNSDMTFIELVNDIKQTTADPDVPKHYDGFILDMYTPGGGDPSERCISKPTILGGITTFTTFLPDDSACSFEGESFLYALFYKTGTSYSEPIVGYDDHTMTVGADTLRETARRISLGNGVAATPSLHVGEAEGVKAFVQASTGEIEIIEEINLPEAFRSKPLFWLQTDD
jgi:type IV pilus assembly protein PilY1